ncbi:YfgM family protein [Salinicola aestuarinus]|uniref:YfgM family protein n=1 Tax=Salinicola aestuarinus TaxID=1949082 RepID=UPI000DA25865|nr:tetratricopeptide repeat protein [Salinicola aestuarinus]
MAELRTEEEQLDAIKQWWKANGKSLIAGVLVALVAVLGWNAWERHQANQSASASVAYQQLMAIAGSDSLDENAREQAFSLADQLQSDHGGSLYGDLAGLLEAKIAVNAEDYDRARAALEEISDRSERPYMQGLARVDLARLQLAAGNADVALDTLDTAVPQALEAQRLEVRGDALVSLERPDEARDAYQQAQTQAQDAGQTLYGIDLKLDDLGAEEAAQ